MLVRFTTKNVDGLKTEWCFNSVEAVLKDWWANDAEKLPSGDDPVLEFIFNGAPVPSIETVDALINFLNIYYWKQQELPEEDIIGTLNTLKDAFVEIESDEIRYTQIQESSEGGYDYTYFDEDGSEIDGGQLDIDENEYQMGDALTDILDDVAGDYKLVRIMTDEEGEAILDGQEPMTKVTGLCLTGSGFTNE